MKKTMLFSGLMVALSIIDTTAMEKSPLTFEDFPKATSEIIATKMLYLILDSGELTAENITKIEFLLNEIDVLNDDLARKLFVALQLAHDALTSRYLSTVTGLLSMEGGASTRRAREQKADEIENTKTNVSNLMLSIALKSSDAGVKKEELNYIVYSRAPMRGETLRNVQLLLSEIDALDWELADLLLDAFAGEEEKLVNQEVLVTRGGGGLRSSGASVEPRMIEEQLERIKNERTNLNALKAVVLAKRMRGSLL
jgi:hypothetical protein